MTALPLTIVGVGGLVSQRPLWIRTVSGLAFALAMLLWVPDMIVLLGFLVPLFGWLPVAVPFWTYPAIFGLLGVLLLPLWLATWADSAVGRRLTMLSGAACGLIFVAGTVGAFVVRPYTDERPARRFVRYVQDDVKHAAWWDIGGSDAFALPSGAWTETRTAIAATATVDPLPSARSIRSGIAPLVPTVPVTVRSTAATGADGRLALDIRIDHQQIVSARVILPSGVSPHATTWAGVPDRGRWTATALALPPGSDTVQLTFDGVDAAALKGTVVLIQMIGVPSDRSTQPLPTWLPAGPATWQARSVFILPATPGES
jgi:hypothetical protein